LLEMFQNILSSHRATLVRKNGAILSSMLTLNAVRNSFRKLLNNMNEHIMNLYHVDLILCYNIINY